MKPLRSSGGGGEEDQKGRKTGPFSTKSEARSGPFDDSEHFHVGIGVTREQIILDRAGSFKRREENAEIVDIACIGFGFSL